MFGEKVGESIKGQIKHTRRGLAKDCLLWRHWGATAGFHTEERLGQNFIVIIDLSCNRVDTGEAKDNQDATAV